MKFLSNIQIHKTEICISKYMYIQYYKKDLITDSTTHFLSISKFKPFMLLLDSMSSSVGPTLMSVVYFDLKRGV